MNESSSRAALRSQVAKALAPFLPDGRAGRDPGVSDAFAFIESFERLTSRVYHTRATGGAARSDEDFLADASGAILFLQPAERTPGSGYQGWIRRYRAAWRENLPLFFFSVLLFAASCLLGWLIGATRQEYASVVIPQHLMEQVLDREAWFRRLLDNPLLFGFDIARNNIKVAITAFVGGALLGLGGLFVLVFNGVFFGAIMGFCAADGFEGELLEFVTAHGPLELTIIIASAFASFLFGRVFYMRPLALMRTRFSLAFREAGVVAAGVAPWLIPAAVLEAFVSPLPDVPSAVRLAAGGGAAALFWWWTFRPSGAGEEIR